jgi:hypothetical protein
MFPSSFRLACVIADEKRENLVPQQRICAGQRWTCHHRLQSRWSIDPLLCWVAQQAQATGGSVVGLCANARKGDRFTRSTHARAIALSDRRGGQGTRTRGLRTDPRAVAFAPGRLAVEALAHVGDPGRKPGSQRRSDTDRCRLCARASRAQAVRAHSVDNTRIATSLRAVGSHSALRPRHLTRGIKSLEERLHRGRHVPRSGPQQLFGREHL